MGILQASARDQDWDTTAAALHAMNFVAVHHGEFMSVEPGPGEVILTACLSQWTEKKGVVRREVTKRALDVAQVNTDTSWQARVQHQNGKSL
jgi:hypothetical protein